MKSADRQFFSTKQLDEPIEGFWCQTSGIYHYFVDDSDACLCGGVTIKHMAGAERQDRMPGKEDCCKCTDIYREIHAARPQADPEPDWTVKQDGHFHLLLYQGAEQKRSPGNGGDLRELARIFNSNGTTPKKKKRAKCAADSPNPEKFIAKKSSQSPPLPFVEARAFTGADFPELMKYMGSLHDDSPINSVPKPPFFNDAESQIDIISENAFEQLRWLGDLPEGDFIELERYINGERAVRPKCLTSALAQNRFDDERGCVSLSLSVLFVRKHSPHFTTESQLPPSTPQTIAMSKAKPKPFTAAPIENEIPLVEHIPASQFRRAPDNRMITAESIAKMSDSIRQVGVLQPITARPVENTETGGKDLEIVLGECRWRGCQDIGEDYPVPCFIRDLTDKNAARIRAIENFQRKDLDEIEEARAIQNLKDTGWSVDEIMEFLGRKKDHIYQRLTLLKLSDEAHTALRDGNITIGTAVKLASLPEESREEALKAVVSPTHAAKALPERQAMDLLDREFIEPAKLAKEWEKRRDAILENHPGAKWNSYEEARKIDNYNSGYVCTDRTPQHHLLSDAAREEELVVPTWGELAKKHGAQFVIGCNYNDEANTYVDPKPLIEAEKAACTDNPEDCIFVHEAAVHQAREAAEQRKLEQEAQRLAVKGEVKKLALAVLAPDAINKTATKKLVESSFLDASEGYLEIAEYGELLGIDMEAEDAIEKTEAAILKYLRSKNFGPLEAAARLQFAAWISNSSARNICVTAFETGAAKPADFPAMHKIYQEIIARDAAEKREEEARAAELTAKEDAA